MSWHGIDVPLSGTGREGLIWLEMSLLLSVLMGLNTGIFTNCNLIPKMDYDIIGETIRNLTEADMITVEEVKLTEVVLEQLLSLSEHWEKENSCHGYQKNSLSDIEGNRIFLAVEDNMVIGYLFGHKEVTEKTTSVYQIGTKYFEIEELYVKPDFRDRGIGKRLFRYVEREVADEVDMIMLGTATKNFRAILHFYIDELSMEFWSARLFKKLR